MSRWTVAAGRAIYFDGRPFISIHKAEGVEPVVADASAHFVAECLNQAGMTPEELYRRQMGHLPRRARDNGNDVDAKQAGIDYAKEQIGSTYFLDWVREQLGEAERMRQSDPSSVLPLDTPADARTVARNMLQQLGWDIGRDLRDLRWNEVLGHEPSPEEAREFMVGVREYLHEPNVVRWLTDEVLLIAEDLKPGPRSRLAPPRRHHRK